MFQTGIMATLDDGGLDLNAQEQIFHGYHLFILIVNQQLPQLQRKSVIFHRMIGWLFQDKLDPVQKYPPL